MSQLALALHAGMSERQVKRLLPQLCEDPDLAGLVRLVRPAKGRGRTAVYQLAIGRVEPLASAVKTAQRIARAGVAREVIEAGLCGGKLTPDNMRRVFAVLACLLRAEDADAAARAVEAQQAVFEAALMTEISVRGPSGAPVDKPAGAACENAGKGDAVSGKGDILSSGHSKESFPSGINLLSSDDDAACGKIAAGSCTAPREFFLDPTAMLAHVASCRADRRAFVADFATRRASVSGDGVLAVRCSDAAEAARLSDAWLEPLVAYVGDLGLAGVIFTVPFADWEA